MLHFPPLLQELARTYWLYIAGGYTAMGLAHGLVTTRDGYCVSLSSALRLPRFFNAISARPRATYWTGGGAEMAIGWRQFWMTAAFWTMALTLKGLFDYFIMFRTLVGALQGMNLDALSYMQG